VSEVERARVLVVDGVAHKWVELAPNAAAPACRVNAWLGQQEEFPLCHPKMALVDGLPTCLACLALFDRGMVLTGRME
jgi:hypothetical protein